MKYAPVVRNLFITAALLSGITACTATQGPAMEQSKIDQIKDGVTTRSQIEQWFGTTSEVGMDTQGNRNMTYRHIEVSSNAAGLVPVVGMLLSNQASKQKILQVIVDKDGIVRHHDVTDSSEVYHNSVTGY